MPRCLSLKIERKSRGRRKNSRKIFHSVIFVYEDQHFLGVCLVLCQHIKVFTNQAEINSLPFH